MGDKTHRQLGSELIIFYFFFFYIYSRIKYVYRATFDPRTIAYVLKSSHQVNVCHVAVSRYHRVFALLSIIDVRFTFWPLRRK